MKTNGDERRETSDERREGGRGHTAVFVLCVVVIRPTSQRVSKNRGRRGSVVVV